MGLDFFRRAVALVEQVLRRGPAVEHTIQTNGTLLDDEWCEFLRENNFLVGLAIDGPASHARRLSRRQGRRADISTR